MSLRPTRRHFAAALALTAVAPAQNPAPATPPSNPQDELTMARQENQKSSAQLAKVDVPMFTEPACHFHAD